MNINTNTFKINYNFMISCHSCVFHVETKYVLIVLMLVLVGGISRVGRGERWTELCL